MNCDLFIFLVVWNHWTPSKKTLDCLRPPSYWERPSRQGRDEGEMFICSDWSMFSAHRCAGKEHFETVSASHVTCFIIFQHETKWRYHIFMFVQDTDGGVLFLKQWVGEFWDGTDNFSHAYLQVDIRNPEYTRINSHSMQKLISQQCDYDRYIWEQQGGPVWPPNAIALHPCMTKPCKVTN